MANSSNESRIPPQDIRSRVLREFREKLEADDRARQSAKPARRRANDITNAIGLTPITGRSGPRIAY